MEPAPNPPQSSNEHTTIVTFRRASGDLYCALTTTHREGEQPRCAISRRIGSQEPSFQEAMQYTKVNFYPTRKPGSITWIDHEFELLANCEILHRFAVVRVTATGDIDRESVDLTTHEECSARVQLAIRLLLKLGV